MQVDVCPIHYPIRSHDRGVDRENVGGRQVVAERDLDRLISICYDDPAEVFEIPTLTESP